MNKKLVLMLLAMVMSITAWAQSAITGTVTSAQDGEPVIGATVKVKGQNKGVVTDLNGKFTIDVKAGQTLEFSYVGMTTQEVAAKNGMKVNLKSDDKVLDEVVVTAMGITRAGKTLGYSATTVKASDITGAHTTNVADALSGKVAGVQVSSTSSAPGAASNIVIRGFSSINGSNQPLYVVDGVPMQQTVVSASGQGTNLSAGGISNIASDDIESMTILKGAAATALYGSRAANGVVMVTTKSGKGGDKRNFSIQYSGSVQVRQVSLLPDMQNEFGQGWNGSQTYIENGSWGPRFDGSQQVYGPVYKNSQLIQNYSSADNNVSDFFENGVSQSHNISLSGASKDKLMTYYLSYGYAGDDGIMPSDKDSYTRNTLAARGSYQAMPWLKLSSSFNYATTSTDAVSTFQGTSVIDGLMELPRNVSIVDMKDLSSAFNTPRAYFTPYGITNPYWAIENNYNHTDSKQLFGNIAVEAKPIKQVTLSYKFGFDYTDYNYKVGTPQIALDNPDPDIQDDYGYGPYNMNQSGSVYSRFGRNYELNHNFRANFADKFFNDRFDVNATVGLEVSDRKWLRMTSQADELSIYTDFWNLSNGSTKTTLSEREEQRRLVGLYANVTLGWDDMVYLDLNARNDWSSTLPKENNSYFYPGATLSWIFTKLIPENNILSFGKVRVAYGQTGNDAGVYETTASYVQASSYGYYGSDMSKFPMNGTNAFMRSSYIGSSTLKPEMTTEIEFGANLQFFKGRLGIDFAYYNKNTDDQIFALPVDAASGYRYQYTNFGRVRNRGIELAINVTPILTKNWRWDIGFNYAKNNNEVVSLPESLEGGKSQIYSFSAGNDAVYMYAEVGKPMGEFYTYLPAYWDGTKNADGSLVYNYEYRGKQVVDGNGQPVLSSNVMDTGKNMNADWTGGVTTSLTWKSLTLSAALDIHSGGYMFSRSKNLMQFTGNGIATLYNDRNPFVIPNSVYGNGYDGYVAGAANSSVISVSDGTYQDYFNDYGAGEGGEYYLVDRSYVKLRSISLTWNLPKRWLSKIYLSEVSLTAFCNNVFTWTAGSNRFIDPENTTVNQSSYGDLAAQFGELYSNPSCRTFGFNLGVKF